MGNPSGAGGGRSSRPRRWAAKLDMYKKVPGDLVEGTQEGRIVSWLAVLLILVLFLKETSEYFNSQLVSELRLDRDSDSGDMIHVSFNITMMDLKCDYIEVDAVSVLGNNQNVTKFVQKHPVDGDGVVQAYQARNRKQKDIQMHNTENKAMKDDAVTKSIEELISEEHGNTEAAISLDESTLGFALRENELVFVDFYASWCSHCRDLAPTWETLAKVMNDAADHMIQERDDVEGESGEKVEEMVEGNDIDAPVFVGKIDCVVHHGLCQSQGIQAYPTLRMFVPRAHVASDYHGHRTVMDMTAWIMLAEKELERDNILTPEMLNPHFEKHLNMTPEEKHWSDSLQRTLHHHRQANGDGDGNDNGWNPKKHPGCQIVGHLELNRVPGNFYIQAYSPEHDLVPHMTNVSHEIHNLGIIPVQKLQNQWNTRSRKRRRSLLPSNFDNENHPMDGNVYITENLHEAYHHYLKLVSVNGDKFQMIQSTQLAEYRSDQVPEAKFQIDFSPIAVHYRVKQRPLYDYISSLLAIIGGTFTVVGLIESAIRATARTASKRMRKGRQHQHHQNQPQEDQQQQQYPHHPNGDELQSLKRRTVQ